MTEQEIREAQQREASGQCARISGRMRGWVSLAPPAQKIIAGGNVFHFEWHHYFGPSVLNKTTGDPKANQPGEKSPFWDAVHWWHKQGCRIDSLGFAIYDREPKPKQTRITLKPRVPKSAVEGLSPSSDSSS